MSKIFEITHRDAAARIGKLVLEKELSTPAIIDLHDIDCQIVDSGSPWKNGLPIDPGTKKIIILPHISLPLQTREEIIKDLNVSNEQTEWAHTGLVVHPFTNEYPESELYILGAAKQL
jgi:archaeosine synthase